MTPPYPALDLHRKSRRRVPATCLVVCIAWAPMVVAAQAEGDLDARETFFEKRIRPLLLERCGKCHGANKQESGLRVDVARGVFQGGDSGPAVQRGKPAESLLLQRVEARGDAQMPPDTRLTAAEIKTLKTWIGQGAYWPDMVTSSSDSKTPAFAPPLEADSRELVDAIQLWLRADTLRLEDGQPVLVWPDSSGKGRDLSITLGVRKDGTGEAPRFVRRSSIQDRPAVRFERKSGLAGSPDHALPLAGNPDFTIVMICRMQHVPDVTHESVMFLGNPAHVGDPGRPLAALIELEPKTKQLDLAGGWNHDASLGPGSASPLYAQANMLVITRRAGPWTKGTTFWLNGQSQQEAWGRGPRGSDEIPDIQHRPEVGVALGRPQAWANGFIGDVSEVMVFDRVLTQVEREGLEATLAARHGILLPRHVAASSREFSEDERNHWAFQPITHFEPPTTKQKDWPISPLDAFVLAGLEQQKLHPAAPADRRTLLRRASFDLVGLPPTPEEIKSFLGDPRSDRDAFAAVIDRLLASEEYGRRWARHWLDVVRYAETTANDANAVMRYAWRYRDYVIDALNADKPYDQFVMEQLAGDLLSEPEDRTTAVIATGMLMLGPKALAETDKEQSRLDIIDDQIDVLGRAFLGLTLACARCHDHKFDPIPTVDYYSLAGIFRSTEVFRDEVRNATMWHEWPLPREGAEPIVVMAPREGAPTTLRVHQRGSHRNLGVLAPRRFPQVVAGTGRIPKLHGSGRLELARWIASRDNPLTPRVLVNRVWQHHFGRGLVATSDNFGRRSQPPTHPKLLDWLADQFLEDGQSVKSLHRRMMLSKTYMQSSRNADSMQRDPENHFLARMPLRRLDAESIRDAMLFVSGRLDRSPGGSRSGEFLFGRGEVIDKNRDFFRPNRVEAGDPFYTTDRRRSIYLPVVRNAAPDLMALFDGADANSVAPRRDDTTAPPQSLFLMNHPFVLQCSDALALRVASEEGRGDRERIALAHQLALGRPPTSAEIARVMAYLGPESDPVGDAVRKELWSSFCQTLLCRNEFLYIE